MFRFAHTPDCISAGTMTATTSARQVSASAYPCNQLFIENDPGNNVNVLIGNATLQPIELQPGQSMTCDTNNITAFWVVTSTSTALVNWLTIG